MQLPRTREWREATGLTQRQLSKESGVGKGTIVRIENGESATPRTAKKIADTLNISVADLLESPPVPLGQVASSSEPAEERKESEERQLERGLRHPQDHTLAKIAAAYGVSVEELLDLEEEPRGNEAGEPVLSGKAEVPEEETGLTDAQLLYKLFDPTVERTPSEAQAARERFLQYNRVAIVISALAELVNHAELVLRRGMFDLQEIESLEEVASGQYFIHKRYARAEVLERGTSEQNATLKQQETRMDEALSGLREAYLARFEQARREAESAPKRLARLEDRHRTHEERIKRTA